MGLSRCRLDQLSIYFIEHLRNEFCVLGHVVQNRGNECVGGFNAFFISDVGVGFGEDRKSTSHANVFRAVARLVSERIPLGVFGIEVSVIESRRSVFLEPFRDFRHHLFTQPISNRFGRPRVVRDVVSQRIAVLRSVGGVAVDKQMRVGFVDQANECSGFRCFEFHEVAVEIESLRICTAAHDVGANLPGAIVWSHLVVGIGAVVGNEQQDVFLQPFRIRIKSEFANHLQQCFFAGTFATVNVAQDQDDVLSVGVVTGHVGRLADDRADDVSTVSRFSDRMVADVSSRLRSLVKKLFNLRGGTGFGKA